MPEETWQAEVMSLREQREMRYDDATLLLLRLGDPQAEPTGEQPWAAAESLLAPAATPTIPPLPPGEGWGEGSPPPTNQPLATKPECLPGATAGSSNSADLPPTEALLDRPAVAPDTEAGKPVEDVAEKLKALSGEIIDETAKQVARGLEKFKEVKKSATSVWQKYLKKLRP